MTLTEYIYTEMVNDGTLDEDIYDASDVTRDFLMQETELSEEEIDDYVREYNEYCESEGITPVEDLD